MMIEWEFEVDDGEGYVYIEMEIAGTIEPADSSVGIMNSSIDDLWIETVNGVKFDKLAKYAQGFYESLMQKDSDQICERLYDEAGDDRDYNREDCGYDEPDYYP